MRNRTRTVSYEIAGMREGMRINAVLTSGDDLVRMSVVYTNSEGDQGIWRGGCDGYSSEKFKGADGSALCRKARSMVMMDAFGSRLGDAGVVSSVRESLYKFFPLR